MTKLKTKLLKDLPVKTTPITEDDYVINTNRGTTKLKVKDITKNVEQNVNKLNSDIKEILEKGVTAETVERVTKEEIERQIEDGTIANLTIKDDSITPDKTTFFEVISNGKNLFNKNDVGNENGVKLGYSNNQGLDNTLFLSHYIKVEPGWYIASYKEGAAYFALRTYDKDKNIVNSLLHQSYSANNIVFNVEEDSQIKYIRINCKLANINIIQLEKGQEKTSYEDFAPPVFALKDECFKEKPITRQELKDTIEEKTAELGLKENSIEPKHTTFFVKSGGKNLLNPNLINHNTWIGNSINGNTIDKVAGSNASWSSTKAIEIEPNTSYVFQQDDEFMLSSFCNYCFWYDEQGKAIEMFAFSEPRISPNNAKYVRIDFNPGSAKEKIYGLYKATSKVEAEVYKEPSYKLNEKYLPNINTGDTGNTGSITTSRKMTKNLFNPKEVTYDSFLSNGVLVGNSNKWKVTGFIEVEAGAKYYLSKEYKSHAIKFSFFYDKNQKMISEIPSGNPVTIPANCKYVRFSIQNEIDYIQFEKGETIGYYIPYGYEDEYPKLLQSPLLNKKYCPIGDSITASGWGYELARQTGMVIVAYNAIGGTTVSGPYDGKDNMCGTTRVNAVPKDAEIITVLGMANDWSQQSQGSGIPLGSLTDIKIGEDKALDTITFCGCYKLMLNRLYKRCPNARIFILETTYRYLEETDREIPLEAFREKVREISYEYGYPLISLKQKCGFNEMNYKDYYIDVIHPNITSGRKRIIEVVKSGILSTIQ